ncbi:MAG: hypothetical protein AB7L09_15655 [Nitrospira sp.]
MSATQFRQLARRIMTEAHPPGHPSQDVAASADRIYATWLTSLSAILGETGSMALFRRSLRLTEATFPLFSAARDAHVNAMLSAVSTCLHVQDANVAQEAAVELLAIHLELLTTFIGQRLTEQLVRETWPDLSIPTREEHHA